MVFRRLGYTVDFLPVHAQRQEAIRRRGVRIPYWYDTGTGNIVLVDE